MLALLGVAFCSCCIAVQGLCRYIYFHLCVLYFCARSTCCFTWVCCISLQAVLKLHVIKLPGFVVVLCGHCFEVSPNFTWVCSRCPHDVHPRPEDSGPSSGTGHKSLFRCPGTHFGGKCLYLYYWGLTPVLNKNHTCGLAS